MAVSNEKVSDYIPNDLVLSIMSKMPLKSLNRFKCVRKSWALLFEKPYFKNMFCKNVISSNSYSDDTCILLKQTLPDLENHSLLYSFYGERFDNKVKLDWPPPFQEDDHNIKILGSEINGILCLYVEGISSKVVLWNPSIEEFRVIPPNPFVLIPSYLTVKDQLHGFGYDYVNDDYKVIKYVDFYPDMNYCLDNWKGVSSANFVYDALWEIYSLKSNSWKKLDLDMPIRYWSFQVVHEQVYMNGVCHWLGERKRDIDNVYLVSFDLGNEIFFLTPIPSIMDDNIDSELKDTRLKLLNESITLISSDAQMTTFHISILGEIGVKESWTKLFIIGPLPYLGRHIEVGKNGDIFFVKEDEELIRYDISTNTIQELGIKGDAFCCQIIIYKKSLLSIEE